MTNGAKFDPSAADGGADDKRFSPSAARNRDPIRKAFAPYLPATGRVLEIGAGTGEHAVFLAAANPGLRWAPSDPDPAARRSIAAHRRDSGLDGLEAPLDIDAAAPDWVAAAGAPVDAVVSINMVHIAPFSAAEGLFAGAGRLLAPGARLLLYGPFSHNGVHIAASNEAFDASLKARDPRWGVRDLEQDIAPLAQKAALKEIARVEMPANNFTVVFEKI